MEYSNLDLTKVDFDASKPDTPQYVGVTDRELEDLADIMAEATTDVVKGKILDTLTLCDRVLCRLSPKQAAFLLSRAISKEILTQIMEDPMANMLVRITHQGAQKG